MTGLRKIALRALGLVFFAAAFQGGAFAQDYPSRPLHWIVPFAPGGSGDGLARIVGPELSEALGQPVVIENRPGGNTSIAALAVTHAAPDGYTVLQAVDSTFALPVLYRNLPYRFEAELTPIGIMVEQPRLLSSNPHNVPAKSFQEFVAYARAHPGRINLGVGTGVGQLTAEHLKAATGIDVVVVPFKGGNQSAPALLAGTVDVVLGEITSILPNVKSGRVRALATTRRERATVLPEVPTLAELGYQFNARSWFGLLAPAGTPREIVLKLNQELNRILRMPDVRKRLASLGMEVVSGSPEHLGDIIRDDTAQWTRIMKQTGIRLE